jgi:16S rRNA (cytosine967-C5)-methyltransferase
MGSVPPYAAIKETVDQARAVGRSRASGMVNAVLRALSREGGGVERFPRLEDDPVGHLTSWGSHPGWLVERWVARFGVDSAAALVEANNQVPPVSLRPVGAFRPGALEQARAVLDAAGVGVSEEVPEAGVLVLADPTHLGAALDAGRFQVQDPGAAMVLSYAAPDRLPGEWYADLCAAPGGKAVGLAEGGNLVVAGDPSSARLGLVRESADRLGLPIFPVRARGEAPPIRPARLVLLDVPCSGTGTLRRHPDARWRLGPGDIDTFVRLQAGILAGGAGAVDAGGLLVYSTCTLEPEENEDQIAAFLSTHPEFEIEAPGDRGAGVSVEFMDEAGCLRVLPQAHGHDGAFAARMRKVR